MWVEFYALEIIIFSMPSPRPVHTVSTSNKPLTDTFGGVLEEQIRLLPIKYFNEDAVLTQSTENDSSSYYTEAKEVVYRRKVSDENKDVIILGAEEDMLGTQSGQKHKYVLLRKKENDASHSYYVTYAYIRNTLADDKNSVKIGGQHYIIEWDTWQDWRSSPTIIWSNCLSSVFVPCGFNGSIADSVYKDILVKRPSQKLAKNTTKHKMADIEGTEGEGYDLYADLEFNSVVDSRGGRKSGGLLGGIASTFVKATNEVGSAINKGGHDVGGVIGTTLYGGGSGSFGKKTTPPPVTDITLGKFFPDTIYTIPPCDALMYFTPDMQVVVKPVIDNYFTTSVSGTFRSDKKYSLENHKAIVIVHGFVVPGQPGSEPSMELDDIGTAATMISDDKSIGQIAGFYVKGLGGQPPTFIPEDDDSFGKNKIISGTIYSTGNNGVTISVKGTILRGPPGTTSKFAQDKVTQTATFTTDKGVMITGYFWPTLIKAPTSFIPAVPDAKFPKVPQHGSLTYFTPDRKKVIVVGEFDITTGIFTDDALKLAYAPLAPNPMATKPFPTQTNPATRSGSEISAANSYSPYGGGSGSFGFAKKPTPAPKVTEVTTGKFYPDTIWGIPPFAAVVHFTPDLRVVITPVNGNSFNKSLSGTFRSDKQADLQQHKERITIHGFVVPGQKGTDAIMELDEEGSQATMIADDKSVGKIIGFYVKGQPGQPPTFIPEDDEDFGTSNPVKGTIVSTNKDGEKISVKGTIFQGTEGTPPKFAEDKVTQTATFTSDKGLKITGYFWPGNPGSPSTFVPIGPDSPFPKVPQHGSLAYFTPDHKRVTVIGELDITTGLFITDPPRSPTTQPPTTPTTTTTKPVPPQIPNGSNSYTPYGGGSGSFGFAKKPTPPPKLTEVTTGKFFPDTIWKIPPFAAVVYFTPDLKVVVTPVNGNSFNMSLSGTFRSDKQADLEQHKERITIHGFVVPGKKGTDAVMELDDEGSQATMIADDKSEGQIVGYYVKGHDGQPPTFIPDDDDDVGTNKPLTGTIVSTNKEGEKTSVKGTIFQGANGTSSFMEDKVKQTATFTSDKGVIITGYFWPATPSTPSTFIPLEPDSQYPKVPQRGHFTYFTPDKKKVTVGGELDITTGTFIPESPNTSTTEAPPKTTAPPPKLPAPLHTTAPPAPKPTEEPKITRSQKTAPPNQLPPPIKPPPKSPPPGKPVSKYPYCDVTADMNLYRQRPDATGDNVAILIPIFPHSGNVLGLFFTSEARSELFIPLIGTSGMFIPNSGTPVHGIMYPTQNNVAKFVPYLKFDSNKLFSAGTATDGKFLVNAYNNEDQNNLALKIVGSATLSGSDITFTPRDSVKSSNWKPEGGTCFAYNSEGNLLSVEQKTLESASNPPSAQKQRGYFFKNTKGQNLFVPALGAKATFKTQDGRSSFVGHFRPVALKLFASFKSENIPQGGTKPLKGSIFLDEVYDSDRNSGIAGEILFHGNKLQPNYKLAISSQPGSWKGKGAKKKFMYYCMGAALNAEQRTVSQKLYGNGNGYPSSDRKDTCLASPTNLGRSFMSVISHGSETTLSSKDEKKDALEFGRSLSLDSDHASEDVSADISLHSGWKTMFVDVAPNITFKYEADVFYGFGNCPYENPTPKELDKAKSAKEVLLFHMKVLKTNCLTLQKTYLEKCLSEGFLKLQSKNLVLSNKICTRKKLSIKESNLLSAAFELSIFSKTYLEQMKLKEQDSLEEELPISQTTKFLTEMGMLFLEEARGKCPLHFIRLSRNLVSTLASIFLKLHQDFARIEECTSCVFDMKVNLNDRVHLFALSEFVMRNAIQTASRIINFREAFHKFLKLNRQTFMMEVESM